jgi:PAS domain S-box-containing protein
MKEEADIVKELRRQEILGKLRIKSQEIQKEIEDSENIECRMIQNSKLLNYKDDKPNSSNTSKDFIDLTEIIENSRMLFELSPEGIAIIDINGTLLDANTRICNWLGYNDVDIHGKNFFNFPFFMGRNRLPISRLFSQEIKDDEIISQEITYIKKEKEKLFGMLHVSPIRNTDMEVTGFLLMISDITNIIAAENEINKLRQFHENVIDNANVWLSVMDLESNVILWNKAAETITGYSREEVLGHCKIWEWLKPDEDTYKTNRNTKGSINNKRKIFTNNYENIIKRKDGDIRIISWNSRVLFDNMNNPIGNIALGQDLTDQKIYEDKIKKQNKELNDLNKNLEERVQDKTKEIKHLLHQKDDFITQLSHDLKTPLTPLMVLLPMLKEKTKTQKDKEAFDVVIRNVFFMKDLVKKTIDLAKLNSDKIKFSLEPLNIKEEIKIVIKNNQILFEKNHIKIINKIKNPIRVKADKLLLAEILNNLITNAIKYTPREGGKIIIDAVEHENMVTISIKDTGIGMNPKQQKQIFDEFFKADDSRHDLDSSGLGLTITKKIVEKHGGKIWVKSKGKGKGSTFSFTLPIIKHEKTV